MKQRPKVRSADDAKKLVLGVEIPAAELAVRIVEAFMGVRRPTNATAVQALETMSADDQRAALRAGEAALGYFAECVSRSSGVQ